MCFIIVIILMLKESRRAVVFTLAVSSDRIGHFYVKKKIIVLLNIKLL
jgi:hypothetical protein